jgi:hypothetical protein
MSNLKETRAEREFKECWRKIKEEIDAHRIEEDRAPCDNRRRGQFQAGWKASYERDYKERTLKLLHWNNLGWRFGRCLGHGDENETDKIKDACEYLAKNHDGPFAIPLK